MGLFLESSMSWYPGPGGFLLILSFLILKFATRSADRRANKKKIKEAVRVAKFANKE